MNSRLVFPIHTRIIFFLLDFMCSLAFAQGPGFEVIRETSGSAQYRGLTGPIIVIRDCVTGLDIPELGGETLSVRLVKDSPDFEKTYFRIEFDGVDEMCELGNFFASGKSDVKMNKKIGVQLSLKTLRERSFFKLNSRPNEAQNGNCKAAILHFNLREDACGRKPKTPQKSTYPPRGEIQVPYRDPPARSKPKSGIPYKEPPPSMPTFRPFESDGEGTLAQ